MVNTRSRAANSKELITRPLPTKRKADVLEDDIEADAESVLDPDEDLIQEITRRVADVRTETVCFASPNASLVAPSPRPEAKRTATCVPRKDEGVPESYSRHV